MGSGLYTVRYNQFIQQAYLGMAPNVTSINSNLQNVGVTNRSLMWGDKRWYNMQLAFESLTNVIVIVNT